jgi:hypothetical protein
MEIDRPRNRLVLTCGLQKPNRETADVLLRAHQWQLEFRQGNPQVVKPLVSTLEAAVQKSPDNPQLWEALGHAYMSQQGSLYAGPPDMNALIATGERARNAYARSLALNADNALVRAGHGMSSMVVGQLKGDTPGMLAGIEEMNAAVRQAPRSTAVRLTRGFTIIHLPPDVRDNHAVTEDLKHVLDTAPGGRPEDVLHVLLGDVFAETGDLEAARAEYRQVSGASAFAAEQASLRLKEGAVSPASIASVRMGTGTRCAMCHAPGTDN